MHLAELSEAGERACRTCLAALKGRAKGHRAPDCARRGGRGARDGGPGDGRGGASHALGAGHASRAPARPKE